MLEPDIDSLKGLPLGQLRDVVAGLVSEVRGLRAENSALKAENRALKDEVASLKGLPPRPSFKSSKPSGMEKATGPAAGKRKRRRRGAKRDGEQVSREVVVGAQAPAGSRFKGYETILVRDLVLSAEVVRYRRERWVTPAGQTIVAPLPAGIVGGWGPNLRRFILACHAQGQVTTERLTALLTGIGVQISKRQVVRLMSDHLDALAREEREVLRAGLATARWITVDDTSARHANTDGYTTQIGDNRFTAFRTGPSKSRAAFLTTLRAGHGDHVINDEALAYMRGRNLAGSVIDRLAGAPQKLFGDGAAWNRHLAALGIDQLEVTPDPVRIATEGAMWGAIRQHGLLADAVIVSDGAGQFRVGEHALCWVHAERLVHKLVPANPQQRQAVELVRQLIWWFYRDLKSWQKEPCSRRAAALRARFDRIFRRRTGYVLLDRLLVRLHRRKSELLRVLERPEIPLHTNGSENDIRAFVTKRKISGGTISDAGRDARDILLGLMKTCMKLGVSFFIYLGDRLGIPNQAPIAPLPDLIRNATRT
ncbi:transposase [Aurantimonas aggregata]|uniref:Transposase n=1 Tax=Aurantimonas aggregata TaxID=2047720 RepID=A0A6L9MNR5_9HYPH|nr:transposase [Aurantimonas aggregata]NDV89453.1 transposase [Aurantimonas aggregata]